MVDHLSGPFRLDDPRPGVTFAVDDVEPAGAPLPVRSRLESVEGRLGRTVLVVDGDADTFVVPTRDRRPGEPAPIHPLFEAVHSAFSEHRPLMLSPDAVWLTIAQGVAHHVANNAEALRESIVPFHGKRELVVQRGRVAADLQVGDWAEIISDFCQTVAGEIRGSSLPALECSFSTTSPAARVASQVCLLDAHRRYFDYVALCICGFPQITLLGTPDDWEEIRARVARLDALGLGWWTERLRPICEGFVQTARGRPDVSHWRRMYKLREAYGTDEFNGWFVSLFAYTTGDDDRPVHRNPVLIGERDALTSNVLPTGLSTAPCRVVEPAGTCVLSFVGGLLGVRQHSSFALEPVAGWAVADGGRIASALLRIRNSNRHHLVPRSQDTQWWRAGIATAGFAELLEDFEEVQLFCDDPEDTVRIVAPHRRDVDRNHDGLIVGSVDHVGYGPRGESLTFESGSSSILDVFIAMRIGGKRIAIAESFEDFLDRCLDEGAYFARPDFEPLGLRPRG